MIQPVLACLDLEGVLVPEIWINVAEKTGIADLRLTTREVPDYGALMKRRLGILDHHKLGLPDIQSVIAGMRPLDGAAEFLSWLRERCQVIIVSDTFSEFALPLMRQLGYPTIFCNRLEVEATGRIVDYHLRQPDQKRASVLALKGLQFRVLATGDAYNDTSMLGAADAGVFFRPPEHVAKQFPQFPVVQTYDGLKEQFCKAGPLDH
ncbi:MAG TPA: bifunctional phosphoserine phosphatase/homoserine phosphotransferase ThrH [Nitrospiraceae bacterium]|nr:bifunctional phosphoserine phosphatase/homoserine phosphotransferase ThrH [Nitrospiraceae bacterium]